MFTGYSWMLQYNMSVIVSTISTFLEFERDTDDIFEEINACIPQFTTTNDTPTNHEKR